MVLIILYVSGFSFTLAVAVKGIEYYNLPLIERPHSPMHRAFKPGGVWGHGLGVLGSSMMILLLLYSVRKKRKLGLCFGKIAQWLNIHIFLGIMGPLLVTLHTAFKFGGFVSVSYYSMMAVMLSGFVGRYLYVQIPRKLSGDELTLQEIEKQDQDLSDILVKKYRVNATLLSELQKLSGIEEAGNRTGFRVISAILANDLKRPYKTRKLRNKLRRQNGSFSLPKLDRLIQLITQKAVLRRKMAFLSSIQPMFHYWHVIHKPFAYVMFIIMFLHVAVTVIFGFRWIF